MSAIAQINKHIKKNPNPIASLWRELGGTDLETQVTHPDGHEPPAHARIDESYNDYDLQGPIKWVGSNGRNWVDKKAIYIVLDIDSTASHSAGHDDQKIKQCIDACPDYLTLGHSKSGRGLCGYVRLDPAPPSPDRAAHSDWGARVRQKLADDGFPAELIDKIGGNVWFWAEDAKPGAYEIIHRATCDVNPVDLPFPQPRPQRTLNLPDVPAEAPADLMEAIRARGFPAIWQPEHGCFHTHTYGLQLVHQERRLPGRFVTVSEGRDATTPNCFFYPDGDWSGRVVRFGPGCVEHDSWSHDDWTQCQFGLPLTWKQATADGIPESGNTVVYADPDPAIEAIRAMTGKTLTVPDELRTPGRQFKLVKRDNIIQLQARATADEPLPAGWARGRGYVWISTERPASRVDASRIRNQFFLCEQNGRTIGLYRYHDGMKYPVHVTRQEAYSMAAALVSENSRSMIDAVTEDLWGLECLPFQPFINRDSKTLNLGPQLAVNPQPGRCDTWLWMLLRLGDSLTESLIDPEAEWADWVRANRITSGGRFLLLWCAWMFQHPQQRVPALAFFGPPDSGKSTLGDALSDLISDRGVSDARSLLAKNIHFTGPVATSVLTRVEEDDVSSKSATATLKNWITAPRLTVEFKGQSPYSTVNCLHYIQTCNDSSCIPTFDRDNRIVIIRVGELDQRDNHFATKLAAERAAFLNLCLQTRLPPVYSRLAIPPVATADKMEIAESNRSIAERFAEECIDVAGNEFILNSDIHDAFESWCRTTGYGFSCADAASLMRELRGWFSNRGIAAGQRGSGRGRFGIRLTDSV